MAIARPFAYNPSLTPIDGTTQVGDLAVGVPTSGFTNSPQFWNGPDEELGYVIAVPVSGNTQPTPISGVTASLKFFRTSGFTDNSFINLSEYVSGKFSTPQTFTGATEASTWLTTNGFWNSYSNSIVTANLQLYLDAGNPSSYSGTGNIWYDLSGNGNDVTMQNSGNISWDNGGFFTLTSNGYFNNTSTTNLPIGSSPYTLSVWAQFGSSWGAQGMISVSDTWGGGNSVNAFRTTGTNSLVNYWWGNDFAVSFSPASSTAWFNFVATWDGTNRSIWVNGVQIGTQTAGGLNASNGVLYIGNTNNGEYLNGNIGQALIYDVALTSTEIMDNFDNTKSNYGY